MADTKLTGLTAITTPASADKLYIVDVSDTSDSSDGSSRQITFSNLTSNLAASGANSDITSLSGLTTPLTVAQGGTGVATHGSGKILVGAGTSAIVSTLAAPSGAIVGTTDTQTLTNKTLTSPAVTGLTGSLSSPVLTTPQIEDTSANHQYIVAVSELASDRTVTLPLLTGNDEFVFAAHTKTLTNKTLTAPVITGSVTGVATFTDKRITKRVTTIVSNATPTVNTDNCDVVTITALAAAITSMTTNLSGTPTNFQTLIFRILDNATGRAITWGAKFEPRGVALPTTTTASKLLTVGFIYDTVDDIWGCVAVADEA